MIDCTNTESDSFQILDPIPTVPPGGTIGQYIENGITQLTAASQLRTITFLTTKISADYIFDEFVIQNITDATPLNIVAEVTEQTTTGFKVVLNGDPDTGNYYLNWAVRILT